MYDFFPRWRNDKYYFFADDLRKYPDADIFVVWSRRGPGKTYSALRFAYENNINIMYLKRTNKDIHILCNIKGDIDLSPYKPINRDAGYNIKAMEIDEGLGGFYDRVDEEGKISGKPFSYCASLNAVKTIKGISLHEVEWLLFDEFIPVPGEKVLHAEGEQLFSIYMTIARDREERGLPPLKLIMFANAENISTPITNELEIVDDLVNLQASGKSHKYLDERGILLHHITDSEIPIAEEKKKGGLYRAMAGTAWFDKAFSGNFSSNDFSKVKKSALKNYVCRAAYLYKNKEVYIYQKNDEWFLTYSASNRLSELQYYNLNQESEQKRFFYEVLPDLKEAEINSKVKYQSYTMYDLINNFKKFFRIL